MHPNDPRLKSFVQVSAESHFPIQNLPFGIFSTNENPSSRAGIAIGEQILDLSIIENAGLLPMLPKGRRVFSDNTLNSFLELGNDIWKKIRARVSEFLRDDNPFLRDDLTLQAKALVPMQKAMLHLPVTVSGYTDFYSSKEHATNVGAMFRDPSNPLLPNWLHLPVAYNGRSSSVIVSGTPIRRPKGQLKAPDSDIPFLAPCRKLDFEMETAFVIGQSTQLGESISVADAERHIFGMVLLNDWSARDIQQWEYVPLGPFNGKSFATSISPWIVTLDALEPFRVESPIQMPTPLSYLQQHIKNAYDIHLEVQLNPASSFGKPTVISRTNFRYLYWTMAQQLAHHTVSGCNVRVGDLMGSGTISGPSVDSYGSLLELTQNGKEPISVAGVSRAFLEDGDEVIMTGWCQNGTYRVGFGDVRSHILPAS